MQDIHFIDNPTDTQVYLGHESDELDYGQSNIVALNGDPYTTTYVCLLAPKFEEHLIKGDLSEQVFSLMKDISISFGWQLKLIDIKPQYLHWVMTVRITTYPAHFIKVIRRETSRAIFENFPRIKDKNLSNDFWAPWYFVSVGETPFPQSAIQTFLKQIRVQQGLQKP